MTKENWRRCSPTPSRISRPAFQPDRNQEANRESDAAATPPHMEGQYASSYRWGSKVRAGFDSMRMPSPSEFSPRQATIRRDDPLHFEAAGGVAAQSNALVASEAGGPAQERAHSDQTAAARRLPRRFWKVRGVEAGGRSMNPVVKADAGVEQVVPFLSVSSMERSLRYYLDGLGFTMKNEWVVEERCAGAGWARWRRDHAAGRNAGGQVGRGYVTVFRLCGCVGVLPLRPRARDRGIRAASRKRDVGHRSD